MRDDVITGGVEEPTLDQKVAFLSRSSAYGPSVTGALSRETHMSWVFLAGDRVYKLKKPVRFPYLDFSTLRRREAACRAELRLNRRLASGRLSRRGTPHRNAARTRDRWRCETSSTGSWSCGVSTRAQTLEHAILEDRLDTVAARSAHRHACAVLSPGRTGFPVARGPPARLAQKLVGQSARAARPAPRAAFGAHPPHRQCLSAKFLSEQPQDAGQARLRARHRRWARRPAPRAYLARRSGQDHRLPRVQPALAGRRSIRRDRVPEP